MQLLSELVDFFDYWELKIDDWYFELLKGERILFFEVKVSVNFLVGDFMLFWLLKSIMLNGFLEDWILDLIDLWLEAGLFTISFPRE